ncbi:MAG: T9SS type A sorting domain-containing protein [Ignavibacteria bacterium]|nr:T9SS type A sorting domain-containing protein [Ignavibacteria bacterium]
MRYLFLFVFLFTFVVSAQKPDGTLPVELVYFQGYFADGKVILFWGTATEVNNYGFNVERKLPQTNWEQVGFVFGSGNSNSPKSYYYEDSTDLQQAIYHYRLKQIDNDGAFKYSDSIEVSTITKVESEANTVAGFLLKQNYPNPFNPTTVISYQLPVGSYVTLKIFNVLGKEVANLVNEEQNAGVLNYELGIRNYELSSGVYFYQLRAGKFVETKKFVLLK